MLHGYVSGGLISKTPAGRWGTTEDLVGPAVFLASDASNFVNGHVLYVDGGILAYIGKQPWEIITMRPTEDHLRGTHCLLMGQGSIFPSETVMIREA